MKSILFLAVLITATFAQGLTKFVGPQAKSIHIERAAYAYGSINPSNSEASGGAAWVAAGDYEVAWVYSPYAQDAKGWWWVELMKQNADGTWSPDPDSLGYQGVARLGKPNDRSTVIRDAPIFVGEKVTPTGTWPQWVGIKVGGKTLCFYYGNGAAGSTLK